MVGGDRSPDGLAGRPIPLVQFPLVQLESSHVMFFCIFCTDKPGAASIRAENRPAHIEYLKSFGEKIIVGGATLTDDGEGMTGSLLVIDVADRAAAEAFAANDPFAKAGLFQSVEIRRWRKVIFNTPAE